MIFTLSEIRARYLLLGALNPKFKKENKHLLTEQDHIDLLPAMDGTISDYDKYRTYEEFIEYAEYIDYCDSEINQLKDLLGTNQDLEQTGVYKWVENNTNVFLDHIFGIFSRLERPDDTPEYFDLTGLNEKLEKKEYTPVIIFYEVMCILYFNEYHKPSEKRPEPDPLQLPAEGEPTHLEKIFTLLSK